MPVSIIRLEKSGAKAGSERDRHTTYGRLALFEIMNGEPLY